MKGWLFCRPFILAKEHEKIYIEKIRNYQNIANNLEYDIDYLDHLFCELEDIWWKLNEQEQEEVEQFLTSNSLAAENSS